MGFPNGGEGGGSPTWEKFPHFPVFFGGERPLVETIPNAKLMPDDFLMPGKSSTAKHQFCANMNKQNLRWREYDIARKKL